MRWFLALFTAVTFASTATAHDMQALTSALYAHSFPVSYQCQFGQCRLRTVFRDERSQVTVQHKIAHEDRPGSIELWITMRIHDKVHQIWILDREARGEVDNGVDIAARIKVFAAWGDHIENRLHFQRLYDDALKLLERRCRGS